MSLGNVIGAAAPIAAGYFTGGAGFGIGASIAAGAATGMGIAALSGNDILMGGVTGGLGGYGGGNMFSAFNPSTAIDLANSAGTTTAVANEALLSPYTSMAPTVEAAGSGAGNLGMFSNPAAVSGSAATMAPSGIMGSTGQLGPNMGQINTSNYAINPGVTGPKSIAPVGAKIEQGALVNANNYGTTGLNNKVEGIINDPSKAGGYAGNPAPPDTSFSAGVERLGDGSMSKGAMKAGMLALGPIAAGLEPEYETFDELREDKYDPYATLNLNDQDTGINDAINADSGLRLYAEGGIVNQTPMNVNNVGANVSGGGMNVNNVGANMGLNSVANLNQGATSIQGLGGLNVNTGGMSLNAAQQDLIDNPKYKLADTGMYGQKQYIPSDYRGMGSFRDDFSGSTQKAGQAEADQIAIYREQLEGSGPMNVNNSPMNVNNVGSNVMGGGMNINNLPTAKFAMGGLTQGPGDGMSDDIPTTIDNEQPAALSDGEFVVPADVVSHLGNGSTEAGSKQLYAMMDEVRQARTGRKQQATEIDAERYMPA